MYVYVQVCMYVCTHTYVYVSMFLVDCKVNEITFFYEKSATEKINSPENWKNDEFAKINTREKSKFL